MNASGDQTSQTRSTSVQQSSGKAGEGWVVPKASSHSQAIRARDRMNHMWELFMDGRSTFRGLG